MASDDSGMGSLPAGQHGLAQNMAMGAFFGIGWYNVLELNIRICFTFKRKNSLYFWSLLISSWGIILHSLGFLLKLYGVVKYWEFTLILVTLGWWTMVTGQSLVLYSRLHLVVREKWILRAVLAMIIWDAVTLHTPTSVLTWASSASNAEVWNNAYGIMERIQMTIFCLQEFIISGLYMWATRRFLRSGYKSQIRAVMVQLLMINLLIVLLDVALLVMEYLRNYPMETSMKGAVYSVKLRIEFAVLNQLMRLAKSPHNAATMLNEGKFGGSSDDSQKRHHGFRASLSRGFPLRRRADSNATFRSAEVSTLSHDGLSISQQRRASYRITSTATAGNHVKVSGEDVPPVGIARDIEITQVRSPLTPTVPKSHGGFQGLPDQKTGSIMSGMLRKDMSGPYAPHYSGSSNGWMSPHSEDMRISTEHIEMQSPIRQSAGNTNSPDTSLSLPQPADHHLPFPARTYPSLQSAVEGQRYASNQEG